MILLYSGGLDSYIAWEYLKRPNTLYSCLNHRYQEHEIDAIVATIPDTIIDRTLNLGLWEKLDADIPMRNAYLCMAASHYDNEICMVVQRGEMLIPDRSPEFFDMMNQYLTFLHEGKVHRVFTPFFDMTKSQMVTWYLDNIGDIPSLLKTRSCYSQLSEPCGACGACFRRWVSFRFNGIHENMVNDIREWDGTRKYIDKFLKGEYDVQRTDETLTVLKMEGML